MPDPLTTSIRFTQPTFGGDTDVWGTLTNSNWAYADLAINQALSVAVPDANVVLVADGSVSDQARYHRLIFTGALTADRTVTLPLVARDGWATNNTTGGHNIILSTGSGTTLSIPPASTVFYACTGTSITSLSGTIAGGVVSDAVIFNAAATFNAGLTSTTGTFSGLVLCNVFQSVGVAFTTGTGWAMGSVGTGAFGPVAIGYGIVASGSNMLAVNYYAVSDVRLKLDIETISEVDAIEWLTRSRPVTYRKLPSYGADPETAVIEAGFIAQEQVAAGYGRYVGTAPCEGLPERVDGDLTSHADAMLTLSTGYQVALLTRALQAAMQRITALERGWVRP